MEMQVVAGILHSYLSHPVYVWAKIKPKPPKSCVERGAKGIEPAACSGK